MGLSSHELQVSHGAWQIVRRASEHMHDMRSICVWDCQAAAMPRHATGSCSTGNESGYLWVIHTVTAVLCANHSTSCERYNHSCVNWRSQQMSQGLLEYNGSEPTPTIHIRSPVSTNPTLIKL
jgi:hypothetical protein